MEGSKEARKQGGAPSALQPPLHSHLGAPRGAPKARRTCGASSRRPPVHQRGEAGVGTQPRGTEAWGKSCAGRRRPSVAAKGSGITVTMRVPDIKKERSRENTVKYPMRHERWGCLTHLPLPACARRRLVLHALLPRILLRRHGCGPTGRYEVSIYLCCIYIHLYTHNISFLSGFTSYDRPGLFRPVFDYTESSINTKLSYNI